MKAQVITGDCAEVMKGMAENSVDAIVTDPPAGIAFMGRTWDSDKGGRDHWIAWMQTVATEARRVLKPGGHALVWSLPRTSHWTATAWENGGFEIRDCISHVFGSGFAKSRDIGKAIDSEAGAEREVVGPRRWAGRMPNGGALGRMNDDTWVAKTDAEIGGETAPSTDAAKQWDGWGSALKPAVENYWLLQKPISAVGCCEQLRQMLGILEAELCKLNVSPAERCSTRSHAGSSEGMLGSAPACVLTQQEEKAESKTATGAAVDTPSKTDTCSCASVIDTCLSIVTSWKFTLEELSQLRSTFTTAMESSLTTDLKTLNYWTSQITPDCIIQAASIPSGERLLVENVATLFSASLEKAKSIQTLSALKNASQRAASAANLAGKLPVDEFGQSKELFPNVENWWLLRKPLAKGLTIAANVLEYGTGGLNIGACRIPMDTQDHVDYLTKRQSFGNTKTNSGSTVTFNTSPVLTPEELTKNATLGRWPANICISIPPDEYALRNDLTPCQRKEVFGWLHENA